jgi:hypothetical protein
VNWWAFSAVLFGIPAVSVLVYIAMMGIIRVAESRWMWTLPVLVLLIVATIFGLAFNQ